MCKAVKEHDFCSFKKYSKEFIAIAYEMEKAASCNKFYSMSGWLKKVDALFSDYDDFTKRRMKINAKALVTTWESKNMSEDGLLHDYSNRQWSYLIKDFYIKRWELWIKKISEHFDDYENINNTDWFDREWKWVLQ